MGEIFKAGTNAGIEALPRSGSLVFDAARLDWQDCGTPGFYIKPLLEDQDSKTRTWLMKVEAGAFSPPHAHDEYEQIYVLEGSFYDQDGSYGPGEFVVRAPRAKHSAGSESGAVVLLFYSPGIS